MVESTYGDRRHAAIDAEQAIGDIINTTIGRGGIVLMPAFAVGRAQLLLYILHGLLHCAGFDDHDPAEHDRMHTEEDRILTAIGVGPVFRSSPERLQGGQA